MTSDKPLNDSYDHTKIQVLRGLEPVRTRPGMYIGDTDDGTGLHHMVTEVVDNSIDEASQGFCDQIITTVHADGSVSVSDNGRGIPTGIMEGEGENGEDLPGATIIMTILHAGAKFDDLSYDTSGGLHGVGVSVVNALSEYLSMTIHREGEIHFQEFRDGVPVEPLKVIGETELAGTTIRFLPSVEVFSDIEFRFDILRERLRELSYLNPGVQIELIDERDGQHQVMCHEGGIVEFVSEMNRLRHPLNETVISVSDDKDGVQVSAALQWCQQYYNENIRCYTNNVYQRDGGTHNTGFRTAVTRTIRGYMDNHGLSKKVKVTGEDTREGLTAILSIKFHDPKFSSQTKDKLVSSNVEGAVQSVVSEKLAEYLEENPKIAKLIGEKVNNAAAIREKSQKEKAMARKSAFESTSLPGKLADCQEKDPAESELFLVEGESAGGSAKQARDRKFQAILPLKGKILNVQKASIDKIVRSDEIQTLIAALGTGVQPDFEIDKLRYHRIIIMTDADVDGSHIRTLLLTFFYNKMPALIEGGHLYIAQPPLYKAKYRKTEKYLNDDQELNGYILEVAVNDSEIRFSGADDVNQQSLTGDALERLCQLHVTARNAFNSLKRTLDSDVLSVISKTSVLDAARFEDESYVNTVARELRENLAQELNGNAHYEVEVESDGGKNGHERYRLRIVKENLGDKVEFRVDDKFIRSQAFKSIVRLEQELSKYAQGTVEVIKGGKSVSNLSFSKALDWLLDDARDGISIQRYKGLGEMNADQLRETTMDTSERMLRKVRIEDAMRTDRAFEVLMGDDVLPRREFIETEALSVQNLDI
ncbi:MAG: DNA gyrase subunit B [Acidiferrobacterales bacterium]|nr:DNA gyrase subunit B [Acidiferrobacterales bacterium]